MRLNTPQVRDLAWVIQSPVLLTAAGQEWQPVGTGEDLIINDAWCEQQFAKHREWLYALDESPQPLLQWLRLRQSPRLGYYFESLVEFWLRHENTNNRLVPHLQIKDEPENGRQRTLGEFDFLLVDETRRQILHWEVAVKFYLRYPQADGSYLWCGPNPRDRLDLKLQRLFQHQLLLSRLPPAIAALQQLGLNLPVWPRLLLKGYLFYRSHTEWRNAQSHFDGLSARHLRGWWTYLEPFEIPQAASDSRWLYLPRLQWLAPATIHGEGKDQLMNLQELHKFCLVMLKRHQKPPLVAEMRLMQTDVWEEVSRGFVLPQNWPGFTGKP